MSIVQLLVLILVIGLIFNYGTGQVVPAWGASPYHSYGYGGVLLLVVILFVVFR